VLRELSVTEQRYQAVLAVLREQVAVVEVAKQYGVTRQSVHNWVRRYLEDGLEGLADRSHRPRGCPHQISAEVEARICELRRQHPRWGPRRLAYELGRELEGDLDRVPSRAAIYRALVRNNLLQPRKRRRRHQDYKRWERPAPMQLWQLDITDDIPLADGRQAKLITGVDDHSRFCVIARVVEHASGRATCRAFVAAMGRYGVPEEVLTDNGKQFTGRFNRPPGEVLFERICRDNGITQRLTKPRSPTTTGKVERFHQTVQGELLDELAELGPFPSLRVAQELVDAWVEDYNTRRPHQALGMHTPAERFQPDQRHPGSQPDATADDDQPLLALRVPQALDPDSAAGGNGDGHPQRHATAPPATHAALDPGPDRRPDRAALELPAGPPAPAVLVPAPLEVQRYVHDTGAVRAFRQTFSVGAHRHDELVRVRLEGRVLHVLDAQGRLIRSVPRDPSKEGGRIPVRAKRMNKADEERVKHQPKPNRQTSTET
jgi:transposase InsO family protein